jgi:tetratricopeptide (TPR) repeat protein
LKKYEDDFDNATFLMPIGAIQCIENIKTLTHGPVMILVSDKGVSETDLFDEIEDPDITFHGSVSMMVNFDALKQYTDLKKGQCFAMGNRGADFQVSVHLYNADYATPHTYYAFQNSLSTYSPQDLFDLAYRNDEPNKAFKKTEEILGLLNLSEWDPSIFYDYYPLLLDKLENEDVTLDQEFTMRNGLERVWHFFFKLEKSQDIPFAIGSLMYHMDLPEEAIKYYNQSLKHFGCDKETYFNMALAYQEMEDNQTGLQMIQKALELQPNYKDAKQLQKELA